MLLKTREGKNPSNQKQISTGLASLLVFQPGSSTNRVSQIGSLNASYDPAGNMTGDGTHTYQWDAENRMISMDGGSTATQQYNALGQRVERFLPNGSWTFDYLFGMGGEELGLYSAGTTAWFDQDVPMGGRLLVLYGSPLRILHANNLGSTTVVTDQTGAELEDQVAYPWGQTWTTAGLGYDRHFAGMKQFESPESLNPTDFRKYNLALGRWMTPDPMGGDVTNPQSLNRYPYVLNNPVSYTDPQGLDPCTKNAPNYENDCRQPDSGASVDVDLTSLGNVGVLTPQTSEDVANSHSGGHGGSSKPPSIGKNDKIDKCVSDFYNSKAGQAVQLFSPLALVPYWNPGWKENLQEWAFAVIGKGSGVSSVVTTGETITTLNKTVVVASKLERFAGTTLRTTEELIKAAIPPATAVDVFVHFGCFASQDPASALAVTTTPN